MSSFTASYGDDSGGNPGTIVAFPSEDQSLRLRMGTIFNRDMVGLELLMRLWTIHPRYLDTKGLLAAWREGLLAQKVLQNKTRGYRNHPQLLRFKACEDPAASIANYLRGIYEEAALRGYSFDSGKIDGAECSGTISCTRGQLLHEWAHLKLKLKTRDAKLYSKIVRIVEPQPHPLFEIVDGGIEEWERSRE